MVPIPVLGLKCNRGCCERTSVPLTLAYARTIHRFQGLSAGPVDEGKIANPCECTVCDPDKNSAEGRALGLLCTAVSRATTLGDDSGLDSAIYFTGPSFNEERLRNMGRKKDSEDDYLNIARRRIWVQFMRENTSKGTLSPTRQADTLAWVTSSRCTYDALHNRIQQCVRAKQ